LKSGEQVYLEFRGVNASAEVWVNNRKLFTHDGGYSTFRVNVTEALKEENELVVSVDNVCGVLCVAQKNCNPKINITDLK